MWPVPVATHCRSAGKARQRAASACRPSALDRGTRPSPRASSSWRPAVAAADLVTDDGAGDAADDGAARRALLGRLAHRHLDVFGPAFLARTVDLLDARLDAGDAAEVLEFAGMGEGQGARGQSGGEQGGGQLHRYLVVKYGMAMDLW